MILNLATRDVTLSISYADGTSPLDIKPQLISLEVQNSHLDESGLIKATGTLTLYGQPTVGFTESLDPRLNLARWGRGARIDLQVRDTSGVLRPFPRGALRIMAVPQPPGRQGDLEIEVGCELAFFDNPDLNEANYDPNTPSDLFSASPRHELINYLFSRSAGSATLNLVDEIPEHECSLYQAPQKRDRSRVAQCGEIAFAAGYVLWADGSRQVRATKLDFEQDADHVVDVDADSVEFTYRIGEEVAVEIVRASGLNVSIKEAIANPAPIVVTNTVEEDGVFYNPSEVITTTLAAVNSANPSSEQRVRRARGLVFPDDYPDSRALITVSEEGSQRFYATDENGYLLQVTSITNEPQGVKFPEDFPGSSTLITSKRTDSYYRYTDTKEDGEEVTQVTCEITSITQELRGVVRPDSELPKTDLIVSLVEVQRWKLINQEWVFISTQIDNKARSTSTTVEPSSQGNSTPPAPERKPETQYRELSRFSKEVKITQKIGAEDAKPANYELPGSVVSEEQTAEFCARLGKVLYGRTLPVSWQVPVPDAHLTAYEPLQRWDWTDDGNEYRYLAEGEAWLLSPDEFSCAADGLYLGKVEAGYIDTPYQIRPTSAGNVGCGGTATARLGGNQYAESSGGVAVSGTANAVLIEFQLAASSGDVAIAGAANGELALIDALTDASGNYLVAGNTAAGSSVDDSSVTFIVSSD